MKQAVFNKSGMRQLVDTGYKRFDKATNYIGTGNVIANTQCSFYIRSYNETECNRQTFPKGHLLNYDLNMFRNIPSKIRHILCDKERTTSCILYNFFVGDTTVGWVITDNCHHFIASEVDTWYGDNLFCKKYNCLAECIKYITEEDT